MRSTLLHGSEASKADEIASLGRNDEVLQLQRAGAV